MSFRGIRSGTPLRVERDTGTSSLPFRKDEARRRVRSGGVLAVFTRLLARRSGDGGRPAGDAPRLGLGHSVAVAPSACPERPCPARDGSDRGHSNRGNPEGGAGDGARSESPRDPIAPP